MGRARVGFRFRLELALGLCWGYLCERDGRLGDLQAALPGPGDRGAQHFEVGAVAVLCQGGQGYSYG